MIILSQKVVDRTPTRDYPTFNFAQDIDQNFQEVLNGTLDPDKGDMELPITTSGLNIVFDTPFPENTKYGVFKNCYDSDGWDIGCTITDKTRFGFRAVPSADGFFDYVCISSKKQ